MSQRDKLLDRWRTNAPRDAPVEQVRGVLDHYFNGKNDWAGRGSSHLVVTDERLIGIKEFGPKGEFSVPVRGGQRVIKTYLQRIVEAIDCLPQEDQNEDS